MSSQTNFSLFTFLCLNLILLQTNAKSVSLDKINKHCMASTGVEVTLVQRVMKNEAVEDDDKYKDFLVCLYKYQDYLDTVNNVIVHEKIGAFLSQYYTDAESTYAVNGCKGIRHADVKELVFQTAGCLLDKLHEVEGMKAKQAQNADDDKNNEI